MKARVTSEFSFLKKHLDEVMNRTKTFPAKAVIGWAGREFERRQEGNRNP